MAQPAKATTASSLAESGAKPSLSTASIAALNKAKTPTHVSVPLPSSSVQQKPQNVADKMTPASLSHGSSITTSTEARTTAKCPTSCTKADAETSGRDRVRQTQEETRRLHFALAQQQVQQYQAMTKQLEAQSGITMTPSISSKSSSSITAANIMSVAGLTKTSEDLQKLRQEQLARLQQNVQRQAAMAAQAVQKQSKDEWLRSKLLLEKEHMRLLRAHEQQLSQAGKGNTVTTATATSIADSLLAQQQQVIRQQQILRDMLQKQQTQQQVPVKQGGDKKATATSTIVTASSTSQAKPYVTSAPTYYSVKKKQTKNTFDLDLEALARVCIRVANARTESEMRQALEKMTSWLHQCTELPLLQIAQRDYRDSIAHRRPMLIQQDRWALDLQVKSEHITQKIVEMLGAFVLREKNKAAQHQAAVKATAAVKSAVATAARSFNASANDTVSAAAVAASPAITSGSMPAVGHSTTTSNSSATGASTASTLGASKQAAVTITTPAATTTSSATAALAQDTKISKTRDMAAIEREYALLKAQLQAKQIETNQKAKAKRDAAKLEAAKAASTISNRETTAAMLAATYKRPLHVEIPASAKKQRVDVNASPASSSPAVYRPSTLSVPPISPRVAQQFYDLDLTTRTSSESDEKMYLPPKTVSKIMYKVLLGVHGENAVADGGSIKRNDGAKSLPSSPALSSTQEHEPSSHDAISISDEAVTFMQECVTEFLLYFTSEARDLSVMQNRRTAKGVGLSISGNNVVESMENLGFTPYAQVLAGYNDKVKASQDAAARKKIERKKLIQQQTMQKAAAAAAAAATTVTNAAKAVIAGRSAMPSTSSAAYTKTTPATPSPPFNTATSSTPSSSVSAGSRVMPAVPARTGIAAVKPVVDVTTTSTPSTPSIGTISAATAPSTKSL